MDPHKFSRTCRFERPCVFQQFIQFLPVLTAQIIAQTDAEALRRPLKPAVAVDATGGQIMDVPFEHAVHVDHRIIAFDRIFDRRHHADFHAGHGRRHLLHHCAQLRQIITLPFQQREARDGRLRNHDIDSHAGDFTIVEAGEIPSCENAFRVRRVDDGYPPAFMHGGVDFPPRVKRTFRDKIDPFIP